MPGQHAPRRSDAEKLSNCLKYITSDGGFHSFGQFLSALLDDLPHADTGDKDPNTQWKHTGYIVNTGNK